MDPVQLREMLGLPADASKIMVEAKLAALMQSPPPGTDPEAEAKRLAAEAKAAEDTKAKADADKAEADAKAAAEKAAAEGDDIMSHPIVAELRSSVADLTSRLEQRDQADKDSEADLFIKEAVAAGKLKPAESTKFRDLFVAAPDVTREIIHARKRGSEIPVSPVGHSDAPEGSIDEFEAAIPDPGKGF